MEYETSKESRVRRKITDYYGKKDVNCLQHIGDDIHRSSYRATFMDGTIAIVTVQKNGEIRIKELAPGC